MSERKTYFEEGRLAQVGDPVVFAQNDEEGRVSAVRDHGNLALVKFESGYEAWFSMSSLYPNRSVS